MGNLIWAIQLEKAFSWFHDTASDEARANLATRERWFAAMKRINCLICDGPITE